MAPPAGPPGRLRLLLDTHHSRLPAERLRAEGNDVLAAADDPVMARLAMGNPHGRRRTPSVTPIMLSRPLRCMSLVVHRLVGLATTSSTLATVTERRVNGRCCGRPTAGREI